MTIDEIERALDRAGRQFEQANRDLHRYALLGIATAIREDFPNATHLEVCGSDQGEHLAAERIIDPSADVDDHEVEWEDWSDTLNDRLGGYTANIVDAQSGWSDHLWQPFVTRNVPDGWPGSTRVTSPTGRVASWCLDLGLILFCDGDATRTAM